MYYYKNLADKLQASGKRFSSIPIVIPSYKRPKPAVLKWICRIPELQAYVFVRAEEYKAYYAEWKSYSNIHIVKIYNVQDLGETRRSMMDWCLSNKINEAFQLDDDVTGLDYLYEYTSPKGQTYFRQAHLNEGFKIYGANPAAFMVWEAQIRRIEKSIGNSIAISSIPMRGFSWTVREEPYRLNHDIPIQCIYINYKLLAENRITYKSNSEIGWEDLYLAVEAVRNGLNIAHIYGITYSSPPMGRSPGGCNGNEPEKTCWRRSSKLSKIFMDNVSNGDPALYIKDLPKQSLRVVRCDWERLKKYEN